MINNLITLIDYFLRRSDISMKLFQILKSSKEYLELKGFEKTIIYYRRGELSHYREFFIIDNEHAFCVWHDGMAGESGLEEFKEYESWVNLTK